MSNQNLVNLQDGWLKSNEAAEYLGLTTQNLRMLVYRGMLKPNYLGSRYRFKKSYLDSVINNKNNRSENGKITNKNN